MLFSRTRSLSPVEAAEAMRREGFVLVDVREPAELAGSRIRGARNIPLGELPRRLAELEDVGTVAFICRSGARSGRAAKLAAKAGIDAVNVTGGVMGWSRAGLPLAR